LLLRLKLCPLLLRHEALFDAPVGPPRAVGPLRPGNNLHPPRRKGRGGFSSAGSAAANSRPREHTSTRNARARGGVLGSGHARHTCRRRGAARAPVSGASLLKHNPSFFFKKKVTEMSRGVWVYCDPKTGQKSGVLCAECDLTRNETTAGVAAGERLKR